MTRTNLHDGIYAVLFALFDAKEALDHGAMKAQVDYCVETGCQGITVLGLATEVLKLTFAERCALIETTARANAGRLPFSVTIAGNSVGEQVELTVEYLLDGHNFPLRCEATVVRCDPCPGGFTVGARLAAAFLE